MAAPTGNKYYTLRSKDGRDKIFQTPKELITAANKYFAWCYSNPLIEIDFKGKDATEVKLPRMRAFTFEGLCNFIDISVSGLKEYSRREDFSPTLTRIKQIIETQQFEGASAGFLNAGIIGKKLGLIERTDLTSGGEKMPQMISINITPVPDSEKLPNDESLVDLEK